MAEAPGHIPVLVSETLDLLAPQPGETAVDCTAGRGGHTFELAQRLGPEGVIVAFDLDPDNLAFAQQRINPTGLNLIPVHDSFANVAHHLQAHNLHAHVLLADLGFASTQMDDPARGFSFTADGPLDMRFDTSRADTPTAARLIRTLSERELADIIYLYGEDPYSRKIARKLVRERDIQPIETTARLARLVQEAYGPRARLSRMHPATRTFMALRIAVNDELGALRSLLDSITHAAERLSEHEGDTWLRRGARIAVVSFHSLEDRMVKHAFADLARRSLATRLTKKPLTCTEQEARANPRARSAKLRAVRIDDANHGR